mgnify:CR=1 FL=1
MADNQLLGFLDKSREVAVVLGLDMEKRQIEGRQEIEISGRKEIGPGVLSISYVVDLPDVVEDTVVSLYHAAIRGNSQPSSPSSTA